MDIMKDSLCSSLVKKKDNWNSRPSCSFSKSNSPLNSALMETINDNSLTENTAHNYSTTGIPTKDTMLVNLEIGDKKLEKIPIKSDTLLQDLAEEFAENEAIEVAYFLNERIKKGGEQCNATDAQVLVKLHPNWKWIPMEDLVDDLTLTLGEAFTGIPCNYQIFFSLAPRAQRVCPTQGGTTSDSQILCDFNQHDEKLNNNSPQEMVNSESSMMTNVQEIKQLLKKINSLLPNQFNDSSILNHSKLRLQSKQTQTSEIEQLSTMPISMDVLPLQPKVNHTLDTRNFNTRPVRTQSEDVSTHFGKTLEKVSDKTRPINSLSQVSEGTKINISLQQPSPKGTEPTQCFIEQLANDLPTQAFNDSIQHESAQESHVKNSEDSTTTPLSRVRVQFDRNFETPLLKDWFEENPVPSKRMIINYVNELNSSEIRKGKNPVTYRAVYIWFKNTRARSLRKKSSIKTDSSD